jgi:hypothetical protein
LLLFCISCSSLRLGIEAMGVKAGTTDQQVGKSASRPECIPRCLFP